ncbi:hypothetical protein SAMN04487926_12169 [Paraburkholderia steynii]|uniref:Glycosyltransferase RgtA/B/C/D-like domain-containing protein n=1 Tax=Paraburkholderia steynii TaxID=1245441 RepID=A0A7Z7BC05_9BURK|nr:hypothetical protein [Paraburkholderia steynii]SDI65568.1 hypothetical protein SAMN04487926_12169 [Paraburkholderia steynii]
MISEPYKNSRIASLAAGCIALLALAYGLYMAIRYNGTHILYPAFSFRQTQTAITSYWACRDGFKLAYETPVAGYPWAIPFEFPLYQWVVSLISCPLGLDLERVGKAVSYAFLILCAFPAAHICRGLFGEKWAPYFFAFCAVFFTAPIHVFFGQAFLMETAALFFMLYFIAYMVSLIQGDRTMKIAVLAGIFQTLAILQKSTTVLPLVPILGFWLLAVGWREIISDRLRARVLWQGVVAVLIPFVIGAAWAKYSDYVKLYNDFGSQLTSGALTSWNFGGDRLNWKLWLWVIWLRNIVLNLGGWVGVGIAAAGVIMLDWKHRALIVGGIALFLLYFMVFTNLQFVHEYYQISCEAFVIFGVAVALGGAIAHRNRLLSFVGVVALAGITAVNVNTFLTGANFQLLKTVYGPDYPVLAAAHFVRDNTDPARPIVVYGDDWSSEFPFFAERKGFVAPLLFKHYDDLVANPSKYLGGKQPSAVMVCRDARTPEFEARVEAGIAPATVKRLELCDIFLKG